MKLSALVLTKNEEDMIGDCLEQLDFADEIVVLDQNSSDKTRKIAKKYTEKIFLTKTGDFDKNRDLLASYATFPWLLYIDADERIGKDLMSEIERLIEKKESDCYFFPRKNYILGKWLRHGGWWPDYVPRLIKKTSLEGWYGKVHESPKIRGTSSFANNHITHLTARTLLAMFKKSIRWASVEASLAFESGHPKVNSIKVVKALISEFSKRYFLKMGFLDGTVGLIEAIYQALHRAMVLTYLWEIQNDSEGKFARIKNV